MKKFCVFGFLFIAIFGAITHFAFDFFGKSKIAGIFFPINESTWEHLKMAILPTLIWALIGFFIFKGENNYSFGVAIALLVPIILIPIIFYTYTYFSKSSIPWIDVLTYVFSVALAMFLSYKIFNAKQFPKVFEEVGTSIIIVVIVCYILFTFYPPKLKMFKDPLSNKYGFDSIKFSV